MDPVVLINNRRIVYSDVGSGPVIVFLHGWMSDRAVYGEIIKNLSSSYRCISIDLPGFGKSQALPRMRVEKIPVSINRLLEKIGIHKFFLVGNSFGGAISILFTHRYPEKVKKLVLISPFVNFRQFSRLAYFAIRYVTPYVIHKRVIIPIFKLIELSMKLSFNKRLDKTTLEYLRRERVKRRAVTAFKIAYQLSSLDLYSYLRKIRKDVLLVYGTADSLLSIKPLDSIFGVVTNIHLALFEDVRHFVFSFPTQKLAGKIDHFIRTL